MFGKSKEEKEAEAEAERKRQDEAFVKHKAELEETSRKEAEKKSEEKAKIMKLDEKEILAEILFQSRQIVQLNKNMVVDLQILNREMIKNTKQAKD